MHIKNHIYIFFKKKSFDLTFMIGDALGNLKLHREVMDSRQVVNCDQNGICSRPVG